jgi:hypothetical protein
MIVRTEDFRCEARIPGLLPASPASPVNSVILETVNQYIEKYEPIFMRDFGFTDAETADIEEYAAKKEADQNDEVMNNVLARLRVSLSHYVAFMWFRSQVNTPIGGVVLDSENGKRVSTLDTQVTVWNQMVDNNIELFTSLFPDGSRHMHGELFHHINKWNI